MSVMRKCQFKIKGGTKLNQSCYLCSHHSRMMECADLHFVYSCKVESDVSVMGSCTDADMQPYQVGPYLLIYSSK